MMHPSAAESTDALPSLPARITRHFAGSDVASVVREHWYTALERPLVGFLARPSKQLRARLMDAIYRAAGGTGACPERACDVIEALHAGSLIVDDIEDGSLSRRGQPTLHEQIGLPLALNAGNWLYFWALEQLSELELPAGRCTALLRATSAVLTRCHEGQALDLGARIFDVEQPQVEAVVRATTELKTGALMGLAARIAAEAAGAAPANVAALANFGANLGVALQMLDDLSGLLNPARQEKGHEDLRLGRPTWPWAWLAASETHSHFSELQELARRTSSDERLAEELARQLRHALSGAGRVHVRRHLSTALSELRLADANPSALETLSAEIHRLEKSYG